MYVIRNSTIEPDWELFDAGLFPIIVRSISSLIRTPGVGHL
jgi:hypothetical protein